MKTIRNILILLCIFVWITMPAMAGTGEDGVTVIKNDESNAERVDSSDNKIIESDGFNRLLMAPVTGVDYLMSMGPLEKAILVVVGSAIGGSVILTIVSLAVNNGRISWGSIFGKYQTMLQGRNWSAFVLFGFLGFLFALALLKYVGTTSIF